MVEDYFAANKPLRREMSELTPIDVFTEKPLHEYGNGVDRVMEVEKTGDEAMYETLQV